MIGSTNRPYDLDEAVLRRMPRRILVDLPDPSIRIDRILDTIDSSMPGGHSVVTIDNLRVSADQMLGRSGEGFQYAQRHDLVVVPC